MHDPITALEISTQLERNIDVLDPMIDRTNQMLASHIAAVEMGMAPPSHLEPVMGDINKLAVILYNTNVTMKALVEDLMSEMENREQKGESNSG